MLDVPFLARPLLLAARNRGRDAAAAFKPRDDDFARVFDASTTPAAIAYYARLWKEPIEITAKPGQSELLLSSARSEDVATSPSFPSEYKHIASHLVAGRIWFVWKYVRPQETLGIAYDGIVWLDDHFSWFPKPWLAGQSGMTGPPFASAR